MKKINSFILSAAAAIAFSACSNETQIEDAPKPSEPIYETLSVKVGSEAQTRVSLTTDAANAAFETGDKIAVWTEAGTFQECTVDGSGKIAVDISGGVRSNYAVYYNGATAPTFESSTLKITLPGTYDYADVAGEKNPVPMVAKNVAGDAADMTFYAVCGLARITLTGIPATADKLEVSFNKDVTGEFTVTDPGTTAPYISAAESSTKNKASITLTPGTDYTGAVINIPVPVGTGVTVTSISALAGSDLLVRKTNPITSWNPARAKGKKATVNFTPSIYYMILAPGNLYTDGSGNLNMAANYYEHVYAFSSNDDYSNTTNYKATNRTHFNFNEAYLLMSKGELNQTNAFTNAATYDLTRDDITGGGGKTWRVPTQADWTAMTTGDRPGATLNATVGTNPPSSTPGWKFLKVVVSGLGSAGTSTDEGNNPLAADAAAPSTDYQAGLLIFPDNVEIDGTFATLGPQNVTDEEYNTTITKTNLDALITAGCAFIPAVGLWGLSSKFANVGTQCFYWTSTTDTGDDSKGRLLYCSRGDLSSKKGDKSKYCVSVRLVRIPDVE